MLIRQHCSLSVTDTHVVLAHIRHFLLQCAIRLQSNSSNQLISFTSFFFHLLSPGGICSFASHPAVRLFRVFVKVRSTVEIYIHIRLSIVALRKISSFWLHPGKTLFSESCLSLCSGMLPFLPDCEFILFPFTFTLTALHQKCRHIKKRLQLTFNHATEGKQITSKQSKQSFPSAI